MLFANDKYPYCFMIGQLFWCWKYADDVSINLCMFRLSVEASDHIMVKQMTAYSVLVDSPEQKGGNANWSLLLFAVLCALFCFGMCLCTCFWCSES